MKVAAVCCLALTLISEASQAQLPKDGKTDVVIAYMHQGHLVVVEKGPIGKFDVADPDTGKVTTLHVIGGLHVLRAAIDPENWTVRGYKKYTHYIPVAEAALPVRWRLQQGCYWGAGAGGTHPLFSRVPLGELHLIPFHTDEEFDALSKEEVKRLRAIRNKFLWDGLRETFILEKGTFSDYFPEKPDTIRVFWLRQGKMEVRKSVLDLGPKALASTGTNVLDLPTKAEMVVPVDWTEPFMVYADAQNFFFITESGKIYSMPRSGKRVERLSEVWSGKDHAIAALITDAPQDRTYVFARSSKPGKRGVFFHLKREVEPREYELDPRPMDGPRSIAAAYPYVAFLQQAKLIGKQEPK